MLNEAKAVRSRMSAKNDGSVRLPCTQRCSSTEVVRLALTASNDSRNQRSATSLVAMGITGLLGTGLGECQISAGFQKHSNM